MKYLSTNTLLTVAFCLCHFIFLGQKSKVDSLQQALKTAKADTGKVNALNQLSREIFLRGNFDTALIHARNAKELGEELNFKKGVAFAYNTIGNVYYCQANYPEALKNYFSSLKTKKRNRG